MNWEVGEFATLQWDMTEDSIPTWISAMTVKIKAIENEIIIVAPSPEHPAMFAPLAGILQLGAFRELEWNFNADGMQIPETKFVYEARLIKLVDPKNS